MQAHVTGQTKPARKTPQNSCAKDGRKVHRRIKMHEIRTFHVSKYFSCEAPTSRRRNGSISIADAKQKTGERRIRLRSPAEQTNRGNRDGTSRYRAKRKKSWHIPMPINGKGVLQAKTTIWAQCFTYSFLHHHHRSSCVQLHLCRNTYPGRSHIGLEGRAASRSQWKPAPQNAYPYATWQAYCCSSVAAGFWPTRRSFHSSQPM